MRTTTREAARLSGVSVRTIQRWATSGRITSQMRAAQLLVDPVEVQELAEQRRSSGRLPRQQS